MNHPQLERLQNDLATVKLAMGGLAYGPTDVRFFLAGAAAAGVFALSHFLGAQSGWPLALAALPVAAVATAYVCCLAASSVGKTSTTAENRREHRLSLVLSVVAAAAAIGAKRWAALAGMSHLQFGGALAVIAGAVFLIIGALNPAPHRHPRTMWWALGVPLIAAGLAVPFVTATQAITIVGALGAAIFALCAAALHVELRRQQ
jgi:hypothetical protein